MLCTVVGELTESNSLVLQICGTHNIVCTHCTMCNDSETSWTAWGSSKHQPVMPVAHLPIYCNPCPNNEKHKFKNKQSAGYQFLRSPAISAFCFPVQRKELFYRSTFEWAQVQKLCYWVNQGIQHPTSNSQQAQTVPGPCWQPSAISSSFSSAET